MVAARKPLRAVAPDETAPTRPKTLIEAVETGDYREILIAQRREIASSLPDEKGPAKAALHRQLSLIAKELSALDAQLIEEAADLERAEDEAWTAI